MIINIIEWVIFLLFYMYWLHEEKRKMFLYELWIEHH